MTTSGGHNVFISHHHEDQEELEQLRDLLTSHGQDIRDSSIDESKPNQANSEEYIRTILRSRIDWAGTMLVLIGPSTHTRPWVDWEIEYANSKGKRIVGVYIRDGKEADVPANLDLYGDALVGWNYDAIMDAIRGESDQFQTPEGEPGKAQCT